MDEAMARISPGRGISQELSIFGPLGMDWLMEANV